ncbi:Helix-turn-helix domain protein [Clostridium vincentii]|uniref:Helix-turn-helix domain protein n=2 Tax=Clostridium vincentii TaxID=52704 RepID=A0A2T0BKU6_9CLOT|nr:Helix-turn-helix domain protein [Clostridium vincentii]
MSREMKFLIWALWHNRITGGKEIVMANVSNQLKKNIKYLRTAYGESQLDLALAVGLDSPNAIANYEKGIRSPKPDTRKKIASHYRITEDELTHSDFSGLHFSTSQLGDKKKMMEMTMLMFPIICTERTMEDASFKQGYAAHMRALEAMKEGREFADTDYDICVSSYSDSYDNSETPESIANLLWWFLISELSVKNQWMIEGAKALNDKRVSDINFYKKFYLKDCTVSEEENLSEDIEQKDLEDLEEVIIELLKELKTYTEVSALADYYIAIRYILGCVNNNLTEGMNKAIGGEMMLSFMSLGNEYAKKFILQGIRNSPK